MYADAASHIGATGRGATPVEFVLGPSRAFVAGQWGLYAAAVIWLVAGWVLQEPVASVHAIAGQVAVGCLGLGAVGLASLRLRQADAGASLAWTGEQWCFQPLSGAPQVGTSTVLVDVGFLLVLAWMPHTLELGRRVTRPQLLLAERQMDPDRWPLLRRALHQRLRPMRSR